RSSLETGLAVTLEYTGNRPSEISTPSNTEDRRSDAGCMNGEWKAPATARPITRRRPRSEALSSSHSTSETPPATTTCPGALMFATHRLQPSERRTEQAASTASRSTPITAAIDDGLASDAAAIARPLSATTERASRYESIPAATRAVYSPSECPAAAAGGGNCFESSSQRA